MDFLKNQLARLQAQFNQLTASQKMLSVSLVTIMVMTLLWWGRYAGQAEMEAIIDQDLGPEEVARLTTELRTRGIPVTSNGSRVLVAADRKSEALGVLFYSDSVSQDKTSTILLDIMSKSTNPLSSSRLTDISFNEGRQAMLAAIIKGFPGVKHAAVVLSEAQRVSFGSDPVSSATVQIQSRNPGKIDKHLAVAAADVLIGAQPTLKRSTVHVIIDGASQTLPADGSAEALSDGGLGKIAEAEVYFTGVVERALSKIDGVMVHVSVSLDDKIIDSQSLTFDPKNAVSKETHSQTEKNSSSTGPGGASSSEPGVVPNTSANKSMTLDGPADGATVTKQDKSDTQTENFVPQTKTNTRQVAIVPKATAASVMMPRSFFIKSYKAEQQTDKDPSVAVLDPYIKTKSEEFKSYVMVCLNLPSESAVKIQPYLDTVQPVLDVPTQATGAVSMMVSGHAKEIALGALALVSLFMVSMMVRKSGPALAVAGMGGLALETGGAGSTVDTLLGKSGGGKNAVIDSATEVHEGGQMLDGVELDDESVKAQQVVEQVSSLVKDNPDAAATLIKRWMNRS